MTRSKKKKTFFYRVTLWGLVFISAPILIWGALIWNRVSEVDLLKASYYPHLKIRGLKEAPEISLEKSRPKDWVSINAVSKVAVGAIIVSEDWAFYSHSGVDLRQLREAIELDWKEKRFVRGASTITQQVAKNIFLTRQKSLVRKVEELILTLKLEQSLSKRKILELYLNIAEWGPGVFGIQRASQYYFKKNPSELNAKEGAFLAMLLPSPIRYGESYRQKTLTPYARERIHILLERMVEAGYLSENELIAEISRVLPFDQSPLNSTQ